MVGRDVNKKDGGWRKCDTRSLAAVVSRFMTKKGLADNCQILAVRSDICKIGQLSDRTTVSADNCQIGQLSVRTTVSGDNCQWGQLSADHGQLSEETVIALKNCKILQYQTVSGNCQSYEKIVRKYSNILCLWALSGPGMRYIHV